MIEQREEIGHKIVVRVAPKPGAVAAPAGQVIGDTAELLSEATRWKNERPATIRQPGDQDQRRPDAPGEVGAAIAASIAPAALGLRFEAS